MATVSGDDKRISAGATREPAAIGTPPNGAAVSSMAAARPAPNGTAWHGPWAQLPTHWRNRVHRHPLTVLFLLMVASNIAGTAFNIFYNLEVIGKRWDGETQSLFETAILVYNGAAWPVCMGAMLYLFWPLHRCLTRLRAQQPVAPDFMEFCRRRLIDLPYRALWVNAWGWLPGALYFPLVIAVGVGTSAGWNLWWQFPVSFTISALMTIAQTFFIAESFLTAFLYPEFFRDSRPEAVRGGRPIAYRQRLMMLWLAVACMPLFALFVALWNEENAFLAMTLLATVTASSVGVFGLVGLDLLSWIREHTAAVAEIGRGNFDVRIAGQRPDEWGRLSNHFNDMAVALGRERDLRDTLGQLVSPEVRDQILARMPGLQVAVLEITVMFADIRGFTRRCVGEPPERIGVLLNRFLTLALHSVEDRGGLVNKFLGDGFMALYGATQPCDDHADIALASAQDLLGRLRTLNGELTAQGQAPLAVGIGIHTGPALVGCFGAALEKKGGMRREFTAIGETVNFCQRLEQLTKTHGGPILLSEATRCRLRRSVCGDCLGPQPLPGSPEPIVVHRAGEA